MFKNLPYARPKGIRQDEQDNPDLVIPMLRSEVHLVYPVDPVSVSLSREVNMLKSVA